MRSHVFYLSYHKFIKSRNIIIIRYSQCPLMYSIYLIISSLKEKYNHHTLFLMPSHVFYLSYHQFIKSRNIIILHYSYCPLVYSIYLTIRSLKVEVDSSDTLPNALSCILFILPYVY